MAQWILRSKRKKTGGLLKRIGKKKKHQRGRDYLPLHIGKPKVKELTVRGGNTKRIALSVDSVNIVAKGKSQKARVLSVLQNPANPQYVRRNIITKGAIIQTELGKARVTSRPGQEGVLNAVLTEAAVPKAEKK